MLGTKSDDRRSVVPRWRTFAESAILGETDSAATGTVRSTEIERVLHTKTSQWRETPTLGHATDLVGAAVSTGYRSHEVSDAADYILNPRTAATKWVRDLAKLAHQRDNEDSRRLVLDLPVTDSHLHLQVHRIRERLRTEPWDAISWVDLARAYADLGVERQAEDAMKIAMQLAPRNRFVLRSASRLWIHLGDPEHANHILVRQGDIQGDPWILAAEIATSSVRDKTSRHMRTARRLLSGQDNSEHSLSELAAAYGTEELGSPSSGHRRRARHLFAQALRDPTENSVAQAVWAAGRDPGIVVREGALDAYRSHEARAISLRKQEQWREAVREYARWQNDQPFSSLPGVEGSYIAAVALEDYSVGAELADRGLRANPTNFFLNNNYAYCCINRGQLEEAQRLLDRLEAQAKEPTLRAILYAAKGLMCFREDRLEAGKSWYGRAITRARELRNSRLETMAAAFFSMELLRVGDAIAPVVSARAMEGLGRMTDPEAAVLGARIRKGVLRHR